MTVSITRLDSPLLARYVALAMDHEAQQTQNTQRTMRKIREMQHFVTTGSHRPQELGMNRQKRPFDATNVKCSAILEGNVRRVKIKRPVQRIRLGEETPLSVRDVHFPPGKGPTLKRVENEKRKPRIMEARGRRK